jgi:nicotinate dehydrogenase subunit B
MASRRPGRRASSQWNPTGALSTADQVDNWLRIEPDGTVTVFSGKVELGTGVQTALTQIVAEELDVPFERITMVMGDTDRVPDEGITAGSTTLQIGGFALRHASAEARQALLEAASDQLDAMVDELSISDGVVSVTRDPVRSVSYAELMGGKRFNRKISLRTPTKPVDTYQVVGQAMRRLDLPRKLTGDAGYVHDVRLPGMLHARVVRPPDPGARLVSVKAESVAGAELVRQGDFLAVAAEREYDAVRAAASLEATWEQVRRRPPMRDLYRHLRNQGTVDEVSFDQGDVDSALDAADTQVEASYSQPFQAHASIGPSCAVADVTPNGATIWSSTQGPYPLREALADLLDMPEEAVRVIYAEGSGSYGHNGADDAAADAALISKKLGRPVRVQWSRSDEFRWEPYAPAMVMDLRAALDVEGHITAWVHDVWSPTHGNRPHLGNQLLAGQLAYGLRPPAPQWFGGGDRNAPVDYALSNQRVVAHWLRELPLRTSSMRTLGGAANVFANESFMDELAHAAQIDPLDFRLRHLEDERGRVVLQAAAERAGWGQPLPDGAGRGLAFARYENDGAYVATVAEVEVDPETGTTRVVRLVSAHDCGLIVNPDGVANQIEGNLIQSLSRALFEEITFDENHITSADWDTYRILRFSDLPQIEVILINRPDEPLVGAGEPASVCTAAAVANAIFSACGARLRQIPLTPDRVREAIEGANDDQR